MAAEKLVPVAVSVVVASVVRRPLLGSGRGLSGRRGLAPDERGVRAVRRLRHRLGLAAVVATALVYAAEDAFHRLPVHWMWWPAIGGAVIGVGGLIVPQSLGVGYDVIGSELRGSAGFRSSSASSS